MPVPRPVGGRTPLAVRKWARRFRCALSFASEACGRSASGLARLHEVRVVGCADAGREDSLQGI